MKKAFFALVAALMISAPAFAGVAKTEAGVGYTSLSVEQVMESLNHYRHGNYGGICRSGAYWCSLNYPAPVGYPCTCVFPTFWFQGVVTNW